MNRIEKNHWLNKYFIAHRGFHTETEPENSLGAFNNAIKNKYAIELDLHILNDGNVVVFHDDNLKRMTGLEKAIKDTTWNEIKNLKLKNTDYTIPLFSDVLKYIDGQVPLLIELKTDTENHRLEEATWEILKTYSHPYAIQSFDPFTVQWFKKNAPDVIRGMLSGSFHNEKLPFYKKFILRNLLLRAKANPDFINYEIAYLKSKPILKLKDQLTILCWTARDLNTFIQTYKSGINCVFENFIPMLPD
ncbi:cytoplasmic glycerophosphodiester phosphodiesterase [Mycoplasmopsis californica]|uniref:GP-PDE domain-containing protein n=1 Tax=Mycoplasmopsis equigenitalium TaxID=114883 RepID=A0ABY5J2G5_9BACT|nr:glycerophosphodiester phosphodiesterase family protein [Mycoplasmopsis equigenitalium]UUD36716.1 hypothetical protein NPA09_02295 [Mycoplasmopsis equigenitalium]VEU69989.1 cytoplasmic glycerophosphodiester phosphodiesterase [Mycoplasmopsis californica]